MQRLYFFQQLLHVSTRSAWISVAVVCWTLVHLCWAVPCSVVNVICSGRESMSSGVRVTKGVRVTLCPLSTQFRSPSFPHGLLGLCDHGQLRHTGTSDGIRAAMLDLFSQVEQQPLVGLVIGQGHSGTWFCESCHKGKLSVYSLKFCRRSVHRD